jgi:NAD(P)-dependent dehydrogenase (short-subunit alcohol dehydrogenase family)
MLGLDTVLIDIVKTAAQAVSQITGGRLDYLVNNAAVVSEESAFKTLLD